jgi:hypothetical protein
MVQSLPSDDKPNKVFAMSNLPQGAYHHGLQRCEGKHEHTFLPSQCTSLPHHIARCPCDCDSGTSASGRAGRLSGSRRRADSQPLPPHRTKTAAAPVKRRGDAAPARRRRHRSFPSLFLVSCREIVTSNRKLWTRIKELRTQINELCTPAIDRVQFGGHFCEIFEVWLSRSID